LVNVNIYKLVITTVQMKLINNWLHSSIVAVSRYKYYWFPLLFLF